MIRTIARREILDTWREGRVRLAAGLLLALLVLALAVGVQHARALDRARDAATADDAAIWKNQGAVNPHSAAHFGRYAWKHAGPLQFVDEGVNPYTGNAVWMEAHVQTPSRARPAADAAFVPVFGEMTAALVLQMLVPLLVVLLAFSAFTGERESGTFRQLLGTGVPRRALVIGKALGLTAALALVLLPAAVIGAGAIVTASHDGGGLADELLRLALIVVAYGLYIAAWIGIVLAVSARAASSRQALVALLGVWLVANLLVPRLAVDVADRVAPVPTLVAFRQAIADDMKNGIGGHDPEDKRLDAVKQRLFKQYGVTRIEELPINFDGIDLAEGERYGNEVMDRQFGRLWALYERQTRVQSAFAVASPLLALKPLSMALAGTGLAEHRDFTTQAEAYRRGFIAQINAYHTNHGKFDDWSFTAGTDLWALAPPLDLREPRLADSLAGRTGLFGVLAVWAIGAWGAAVWALRRAPVDAAS